MRKIREILYVLAAATGCGLLPFGCVKEDAAPLGEQHSATVQLNIGSRAVSEADGTPADDESAVHTLRVYAFVGGQPAGHYFASDVDMTSGRHTFYMDITFYTDGVQTVDFYAVANEAAMTGATSQLSETTNENWLNNYWFTDIQENTPQYGLPMYCEKTSYSLDFSNVKDGSPDDPAHAGHSWLDYDNITLSLKRPFGKLGVFAAKPADEEGTLYITGLTMLEQDTRLRNYLMPQTDATLQSIAHHSGDYTLTPVTEAVTATLAENVSEADRRNPDNYTPVLDTPFYPFENPYANGGAWNIPGADAQEHVLKIDYHFDGGEERTGYVYMPRVERNHYYAVCCLIHNDGRIFIEYTVADWDDAEGGAYDIDYNYPQYTNPIQPDDGTTLEGDAQYPQPTVWHNADETSEAGSYTFRFNIVGPTGQKWPPVLLGTLATSGNFSVEVYQSADGGLALVDPSNYVASSEPYYIRVKALKSENVGGEVGLAIAYDRTWTTDTGDALLLINGLTGNLKWEGSTVAEVVMIRQIDIPITDNNN